MYKSYGVLRPVVIIASTIAILQSLAWIAISVMGIIAYYCLLSFRGTIASLGTLTELTLFHMYFHGSCSQSGMPNIDYNELDRMNLIRPQQVHICMWIYLSLSSLWLISSITLLTSVRYVNLRNANAYLYVWIFLTVFLSLLDLGFGVAFGIDYDTLRNHTHSITLDNVNKDRSHFIIVAAKTSAGIMIGICFRGFTIWIINIILSIYFFTQTFKISDYNRIKKTLAKSSRSQTSGSRTTRSNPNIIYGPRYDQQWNDSLNNNNYGTQTLPLDRSSKHRSSQAAALFEERKRHYEAQQLNYLRFIDKRNGKEERSKIDHNCTAMQQTPHFISRPREITVPVPDYNDHNFYHSGSIEPRMPLRSALRSSRY